MMEKSIMPKNFTNALQIDSYQNLRIWRFKIYLLLIVGFLFFFILHNYHPETQLQPFGMMSFILAANLLDNYEY